jgi:hypothetical protein
MAREKHKLHPLKRPDYIFIGRFAKWGVHDHVFHPGEPFHLVKTAATDHTDNLFSHKVSYTLKLQILSSDFWLWLGIINPRP